MLKYFVKQLNNFVNLQKCFFLEKAIKKLNEIKKYRVHFLAENSI